MCVTKNNVFCSATKLYTLCSLLLVFLFPFANSLQLDEGKLCPLEKHASLFIFGDSYFDAGNNNYINTTTGFQANFGPYSESFFKYPTGRFFDGRIIPDFIGKIDIKYYVSFFFKMLIVVKMIVKALFFSRVCKVAVNYTVSTSWLS